MDHHQQRNPIIQSPAIEPPWTDHDHDLFLKAVVIVPEDIAERWQKIADGVPGKTADEVKAYHDAWEHILKEILAGRVELPHYPEDDDVEDDGVGDQVLVSSDTELRTSQISFGNNNSEEKERKKGTPWTIEEHRRFLAGLEAYGKGDWRSISRNVVITRTATQVASHAQKYFLRQKAEKKQKRRSSIHDITITDTTTAVPSQPATSPPPQPKTPPATGFHGGRKTGEPAPPTLSPPGFSGGQAQSPLAPHTTGIFNSGEGSGGQPPLTPAPINFYCGEGSGGQPPLALTPAPIDFYCGGESGGQPPLALTPVPIDFYGGGESGGQPPLALTPASIDFYGSGGSGSQPLLTPAPVNCYAGDGGERGGAPSPPPIDFCWEVDGAGLSPPRMEAVDFYGEQGGAPPPFMGNIQCENSMYDSFLS